MYNPSIIPTNPKGSSTISSNNQNSITPVINSLLEPNLEHYDLNKVQIIWYRNPSKPYDLEELSYNYNQSVYQCTGLDYKCYVICKIISQEGNELESISYGPIGDSNFRKNPTPNYTQQTNEYIVEVNLFNSIRKCILSLNTVPTLINPQNNNKYQLTTQDIKSIYPKVQQNADKSDRVERSSLKNLIGGNNSSVQSSVQNKSRVKCRVRGIVVGNLFQRIILLKLFHEVTKEMYCYSLQLLQINFIDPTQYNNALMIINRLKYPKKQPTETMKSMVEPCQKVIDGIEAKFMKNSNLEPFKPKQIRFNKTRVSEVNSTNSHVESSSHQISMKNRFSPTKKSSDKEEFKLLLPFQKSPKESINSANDSSNVSNSNQSSNYINSQNSNQNAASNRSLLNMEANDKTETNSSELQSQNLFRQPKISIVSTEMATIKQRQIKSSLPDTPPPTSSCLKSSQMLLKPSDTIQAVSTRRSQDGIKTPRIYTQESVVLSRDEDEKSKSQYVDEFQNLLYEGQESNTEEMCLNESFAKLEEDEAEQNSGPIMMVESCDMNQLLSVPRPTSPAKSDKKFINVKEKIQSILEGNKNIRIQNQKILKEVEQLRVRSENNEQIIKLKELIAEEKEKQAKLEAEILELQNKEVVKQRPQNAVGNSMIVKQTLKSGGRVSQGYVTNAKWETPNITRKSSIKDEVELMQSSSELDSPTFPVFGRYSRGYEMASKKLKPEAFKSSGVSPSFLTRKQHEPKNFQEGERMFMKNISEDIEYQKYRNNQSYSYQTQQSPLKGQIGFNGKNSSIRP